MSWLAVVLSFVAGVICGLRLPAMLTRWQAYQARRRFKPVALRPYQPAPIAGHADSRSEDA